MRQAFGEYIKEMRTNKGWTLTQLAAQLDLDSANLSKIENNKRAFHEKRLEKLATAFNLELDTLRDELFSEQFAQKIYSNSCSVKALELAEEKVKYYKQSNVKPGSLKF